MLIGTVILDAALLGLMAGTAQVRAGTAFFEKELFLTGKENGPYTAEHLQREVRKRKWWRDGNLPGPRFRAVWWPLPLTTALIKSIQNSF